MQVRKGLATWAGLVAAAGQYALAIATFMNTFDDVDPTAGLGALATATATLYGVIKGRMDQAAVLAARAPLSAPVYFTGSVASSSGATGHVTWGPGGPLPATKPGEFAGEPDAPPEHELRDLHENEQS